MNTKNMNMGQMREIQKVLGLAANEFDKDVFGLMAAMAWQVKKAQGDKNFTFNDALKLDQEEVAAILGNDEDPLEEA